MASTFSNSLKGGSLLEKNQGKFLQVNPQREVLLICGNKRTLDREGH